MRVSRRWLIIGGAIVVLGGALAYRAAFLGKKTVVHTVDVRRGSLTEEVSETGTVVAREDIDLSFKNVGRVARISVKEGDQVEVGQLLMSQQTGELRAKLQSAISALVSAQAKYSQALAGSTAEEIRVFETGVVSAQADVNAATQALADAKAALADTAASNEALFAKTYGDLDGVLETLVNKSSAGHSSIKNDLFDTNEKLGYLVAPESLTLLASQVAQQFAGAKTAMSAITGDAAALRATADSASIDALAGKIAANAAVIINLLRDGDTLMQGCTPSSSLSQSSYDTKKSNVRTALTDLNTALNSVNAQILTVASTKTANAAAVTTAATKVNTAQAALDGAKAALQSAEDKLALERAPLREVDREVFRAAVAAAQAEVDLMRRQLEESDLVATSPGIVGSIDLSVGEIASPTARAVSLISRDYEIEANVSELDIRKITVGMPATLVFDALGPVPFIGKITKIGARETKQDEDIFYEIAVVLDDAAAPLKPGMTADIVIAIGSRDNALLVPKRLLIKRGASASVRVIRDDDVIEEVGVRVGLEGDIDVEILDGLKGGEKIVDRIEE